jgi:hypothetical protein
MSIGILYITRRLNKYVVYQIAVKMKHSTYLISKPPRPATSTYNKPQQRNDAPSPAPGSYQAPKCRPLLQSNPNSPRQTPPPTHQDQRCRYIHILPERHGARRTEDCTLLHRVRRPNRTDKLRTKPIPLARSSTSLRGS